MAPSRKPRYVDTTNPELSIDCPRCGLKTARFMDHCRNCSYKLWPSGLVASAAFQAWRDAQPADRDTASRFSLEVPVEVDNTVDFEERAHELGIHLFPPSNWPFIICFGLFFVFLAGIPWANWIRITMAIFGGVIFLVGVVGWVVLEDTRIFPHDAPAAGHGEAHH